ncbi:hypothetical protein ABK040_001623 [Willaertia magna]
MTIGTEEHLKEEVEFHLNTQQTVATFFPPKEACYNRKLNALEGFMTNLYTRGGVCFKGEINLNRFLEAMNRALHSCDFLFGRFHKSEEGIFVKYSTIDNNNNTSFKNQLEIEKREEVSVNSSTITLESILPLNIVDDRMRFGFVSDIEGLPVCVFKLTILKDGFAIGHYINHSFFDQGGIYYFLKYLSHLYTHESNSTSIIKKPKLVDLVDFLETEKCEKNSKDIEEVRKFGEEAMGFKYNPTKVSGLESSSTCDKCLLKLKFNLVEIEKLKNQAGQFLSTNDIIHAILLKIYAFNSSVFPSDNFCLRFACNMRKRCGLGEESIANFVNLGSLTLTIEEIRSKTIIELAIDNRECLSEINVEGFKQQINWFENVLKRNENPLNYLANAYALTCQVTNWTTFDYDSIRFDNNTIPVILISVCLAPYGVNVLLYETQDDKRVITNEVSVPNSSLNSIKELAQTTNLFSY